MPPASAIEKLVKLVKTPQGAAGGFVSSTSRGARTPKIPTCMVTEANQASVVSAEFLGAPSVTSSKTYRKLISSAEQDMSIQLSATSRINETAKNQKRAAEIIQR